MKEGRERKEGEKDGGLYGWNKTDLLPPHTKKRERKKRLAKKEGQ